MKISQSNYIPKQPQQGRNHAQSVDKTPHVANDSSVRAEQSRNANSSKNQKIDASRPHAGKESKYKIEASNTAIAKASLNSYLQVANAQVVHARAAGINLADMASLSEDDSSSRIERLNARLAYTAVSAYRLNQNREERDKVKAALGVDVYA